MARVGELGAQHHAGGARVDAVVHGGEFPADALEIGFNAKFLTEMLNNLSAKMLSFEMSAPNRAGLVIPADKEENEDILMLVMPVMLNTYA